MAARMDPLKADGCGRGLRLSAVAQASIISGRHWWDLLRSGHRFSFSTRLNWAVPEYDEILSPLMMFCKKCLC